MPIRASPLRRKRGVLFHKMVTPPTNAPLPSHGRVVEIPSDSTDIEDSDSSFFPPVPSLFTTPPTLRDALITETSEAQDATLTECLSLLSSPEGDLNSHGLTGLARAKHVKYLKSMMGLNAPFPKYFTVADASRPWFVYWALTGLYLLGEDVGVYRGRVVDTARSLWNVGGGFGGGFGQFSHVATSYAMLLSLVFVGGEEALGVIDRKAMWHWLGRIKQPDGGFSMAEGGEVDIRGAYCAMTIIALLNLPLELPPDSPARFNGDETFLTNLEDWISRCQSYEGGIAGAPGNEAHGAYAFCALACLCIVDAPARSIAKNLDTAALISCLTSLQHAPEPGFAGRTNKLVDACYSHWVGNCFPLLSAGLSHSPATDLWSREGLVRYILCCGQNLKSGGLRDKPSKMPDSYHTCYVLSGLSGAQHVFEFEGGGGKRGLGKGGLVGWRVNGRKEGVPVDEADEVRPLHPVFVVSFEGVEECRRYFEERAV